MEERIYILCTWQPWPLGRLARLVGMKWSHALLIAEFGMRNAESGSRRWVYEARPRGIVKALLNPGHLGCEYQVFETVQALSEWQLGAVYGAAEGMCGKSYNYGLLLRLAIRTLKELLLGRPAEALARPAEVCSSFVQECFRIAGVDLVPGRIALPDDLAASELLREIEEKGGRA